MISIMLPQYMVKKRGMVKKEVNKMIGITDAFDCEYGLSIGCFTSPSPVFYCIQDFAHFVLVITALSDVHLADPDSK